MTTARLTRMILEAGRLLLILPLAAFWATFGLLVISVTVLSWYGVAVWVASAL